MDKFREKMASIRAEAEAANARADDLETKLKQVEATNMAQEHEIISLTNQNKHLEHDLEVAQEKILQLRSIEEGGDDLQKEKDAAQRKIALLEEELETAEKTIRETTQNFRQADVKAEHFERKVNHLENQVEEQERKNAELVTRIKDLQQQLDEFTASLDDI